MAFGQPNPMGSNAGHAHYKGEFGATRLFEGVFAHGRGISPAGVRHGAGEDVGVCCKSGKQPRCWILYRVRLCAAHANVRR